jgi:DNA primase
MASLAQIDQIKARLSISAIVKEAVKLRPAGNALLGLCPFHQEKTPSFNVRDQDARFKCFGCGAGGDIFEFVMRLRGISFKEAIAELAERAGVSIVSANPKKAQGAPDAPKSADLLSIQNIAQKYFVSSLLADNTAKGPLDYLVTDRGLDREMIRQAGIGFGGASTAHFIEALKKAKVPRSLALEAGLFGQNSTNLKAQFLGRITFPIRDWQGRILGFGGRIWQGDAEAPKYLNTHTNALFEKRKLLYGLFESKPALLKGMSPVVVEGYFDAMAFWAVGIPAVALCGTALSEAHLKLLKPHISRLTLCFDNDQAGLSALIKALPLVFREDFFVNLIELSQKDAGVFLAQKLLPTLKKEAAVAKDAFCHVIDHLALKPFLDIRQKIDELDRLMPIFASIKRPILRRQYVAYCAQKLQEDPKVLWQEIENKIKKSPSKSPVAVAKDNLTYALTPTEKSLAQVILKFPHLSALVGEGIVADLSPDFKALLKVLAEAQPGQFDGLGSVLATCSRDFQKAWAELAPNEILVIEEVGIAIIKNLNDRALKRTRQENLEKMRLAIKDAEAAKDFSKVLLNLKEQSSLLAKSKKPKPIAPKAVVEASPKPTRREAAPMPPTLPENFPREIGTILEEEEDWLY